MSSARAIAAAGVLAAILGTGPAAADMRNTPECQRDLTIANRLIDAIAAREKHFVRGQLAANCQLLRLNLVDMVKAREPMNRCLVGHEHGETVAQMDASIEDIRGALAGNCRQ